MLHLNGLGLGVSYNRALEISALLDETVLAKYFEDSVVFPPISKKGLFITSAIDIIDYNPTTRTQELTRQLLLP